MHSEKNAKEAAHARAVRNMFAGIASRYDLLNHLLSLNIDKRWRKAVSAELSPILNDRGSVVLDAACGTGDLSLELNRNAKAKVIGSDFCRPMLELAQTKSAKEQHAIPYVEADAMRLPFNDDQFNAVTIAFGLRNLANVSDGLTELHRVLKNGGRIAVLEFSAPIVPGFGAMFNFYFSHVLPRIGGAVSGSRDAYEYLPGSVAKFPDQKALAEMMKGTGFGNVKFRNLTGGIAALHSGTKTI